MKATIIANEVINSYGVFKRGDKVDWREADLRPMLDVSVPSAIEGHVAKKNLPKQAKPDV